MSDIKNEKLSSFFETEKLSSCIELKHIYTMKYLLIRHSKLQL